MSKRQGTLNAAYSSKIRAKSGKLARSGLYKHLNELLYYNQIVCIEYNPSCDIFTKNLDIKRFKQRCNPIKDCILLSNKK